MKTHLNLLYFILIASNSILAQSLSIDAQLDSLYKTSARLELSGDYVAATEKNLEAIKIAEKANNNTWLCKLYLASCNINIQSENLVNLEETIQKAFQYCHLCNDTLGIARVYSRYGVLSFKQAKLDSSIYYFQKSADIYKAKGDSVKYAATMSKVGNVLEEKKDYETAYKYYKEYYDMAMRNSNDGDKLNANVYLACNSNYRKKGKEALQYNEVAKMYAKKLDAKYQISYTKLYDAMAYENLGEYKRAFDALQNYVYHYRDTFITGQHVSELQSLKTKFETEKKESIIKIQDQKLANQRNTLIAGGIIMAILLGAGILLFRLNEKLKKRNQEKEFLFKELHHRVKNNLQVLSSLLHLQSKHLKDPSALDALREGQNRVDAMGLIHQKLYRADDVASVEMNDYLIHLSQSLLDSFGLEDKVNVELDVPKLNLKSDLAIPLGLIINELITNSLKYAFSDGRNGVIKISLHKDLMNQLTLIISDNGIGKADHSISNNNSSFGLNLVQLLSNKLHGQLSNSYENGTLTKIIFNLDKL